MDKYLSIIFDLILYTPSFLNLLPFLIFLVFILHLIIYFLDIVKKIIIGEMIKKHLKKEIQKVMKN
mgnify:CR=1 FL=1